MGRKKCVMKCVIDYVVCDIYTQLKNLVFFIFIILAS